MRLTFLGTGTSQGVPVITCQCAVCKSLDSRDKRLRTSAMVEINNSTIVIDTGPDFRQQMLRANPAKVDAVLFTHSHKDHIAGMDDIRAFNYRSKKDMPIYATVEVQEALKREFYYVFNGFNYPGIPKVKLHTIDEKAPFNVEGIEVTPINVLHYKLPVLGFKIGAMAYITDANFIAPEEKEKLKNLDVLVLNALRKEPHISHFNLEEALALVEELKPKRAYFTHLSHLMGTHEEVQAELPDNVFLAYDQLAIEVATT
jgi:phosphoribosyl 1,2-cyclic phosphate phosphodiesterase